MSSHLPSSLSPATLLTHARKGELLEIARQSRIKWINQGNEMELRRLVNNTVSKISSSDESQRIEMIKREIPVVDAIQEVLELFSDLISDGEHVDLESIISFTELDGDNDSENDNYDFDYYKNDTSPLLPQESSDSTYDYLTFLRKLRHSTSKDVVNALRQYVTKFQTNYQNIEMLEQLNKTNYHTPFVTTVDSIDIDVNIDINNTEMNKTGFEIWGFIDSVLKQIRQSPAWMNETNEQAELTENYLEKFLFQKLHKYIFATTTEDVVKDQRLYQRIQSLSFIRPEHLDLHQLGLDSINNRITHTLQDNSNNSATFINNNNNNNDSINTSNYHHNHPLKEPIRELNNMMNAQSPVDKLNHLKLCTQALTDTLADLKSHQANSSSSSSHTLTAVNAGISDCDMTVGTTAVPTPDLNATVDLTTTTIFDGVNISNPITSGSSSSSSSSVNASTTDGVDVYLPLMIYLLKESNPHHLYSNVVYLQRYTPSAKLNSECGYLLTYFISAVHFLETADTQTLTISPQEFNSSIRKCHEEMNKSKYHHHEYYTLNNNHVNVNNNVNGSNNDKNNSKLAYKNIKLDTTSSIANSRLHATATTAGTNMVHGKKDLLDIILLIGSSNDNNHSIHGFVDTDTHTDNYTVYDEQSGNLLTDIDYSDVFDTLFLKSKISKSSLIE